MAFALSLCISIDIPRRALCLGSSHGHGSRPGGSACVAQSLHLHAPSGVCAHARFCDIRGLSTVNYSISRWVCASLALGRAFAEHALIIYAILISIAFAYAC